MWVILVFFSSIDIYFVVTFQFNVFEEEENEYELT